MNVKNFTIGMAGHIDHGKTSLTKALTNVETDRLKEEKERNISIELGYAPLKLSEDIHASVIDVPGHEKFIRQMIAGVAGIDLVVLVIAADEGIMPQTKEHMEILSFLGIKNGIIAISKIDRVDEEFLDLVSEDIKDQLKGTIFSNASMVYVDSISKKNLDVLQQKMIELLTDIETRDPKGAFRLPIDQVFSVQGQGTVVRGTVYEGIVRTGDQLVLLPEGEKVKVRQMQVHHQEVEEARAGQRVAINLGGISKNDLTRGDVLVSSEHFIVTDTVDIVLNTVEDLDHPLKQRAPIKLHIGTAEVMGKIVFFDRNELSDSTEDILCQLRLEEPIVTKRGDKYILRRPTPIETIGGGWIIDPAGEKYRFGEMTIQMLKQKKEGTPEERIIESLRDWKVLSIEKLIKETSLNKDEILGLLEDLDGLIIKISQDAFALTEDVDAIKQQVKLSLEQFHATHQLRVGQNKAEMVQILEKTYPKRLIEFSLDKMVETGEIRKEDQYIQLGNFSPTYPAKWEKRIGNAINRLKADGLEVKDWEYYLDEEKIPTDLQSEIKYFLIQLGDIHSLSDKLFVHSTSIEKAAELLKEKTGDSFTLKEAKDYLNLSRKYLIPLLELFDKLKLTIRIEDKRKWV